MPHKPLRPCRQPGCPQLTAGRYCPTHERQLNANLQERRGTRTERGYDYQWQQVRLMVLRREPWCRRCKANGLWTLATLVDHIIPLPEGPRLLLENLQPLCDPCHITKTAEDAARKCQGRGGPNR